MTREEIVKKLDEALKAYAVSINGFILLFDKYTFDSAFVNFYWKEKEVGCILITKIQNINE